MYLTTTVHLLTPSTTSVTPHLLRPCREEPEEALRRTGGRALGRGRHGEQTDNVGDTSSSSRSESARSAHADGPMPLRSNSAGVSGSTHFQPQIVPEMGGHGHPALYRLSAHWFRLTPGPSPGPSWAPGGATGACHARPKPMSSSPIIP